MDDVQLFPWVLSGVTSITTAVWAALAVVYRGRIKDLRDTIASERAENRALMERLFRDQSTAAVASTAATTAAVAAATSAATPVGKPGG